MSEANIALVRRAFDEVASQGKLDVLDEIAAPDFVRHDLAGGRDIAGLENIKRFMAAQRAAFPDLSLAIDELVAQGDRVVARFTGRGTHRGELMGIAPTGREVSWAGINVYRIEGGRLAETWQLADVYGMLRQLGAVPPPQR